MRHFHRQVPCADTRNMAAAAPDGLSTRLPGRCAFYVAKKKRFCKMLIRSGNEFCGEHASSEKETKKRRIACPLDPKHTVFEDHLAKHLKKCNSREKPKPVYYVQDINAGPSSDEDSSVVEVPLVDRSKAELDLFLKKLRTAVKTLNCKHEDRALSHLALNEALNDPKNGDSACKHLKQQASLLANMEGLNLLGPNRCFVEFGAGKGKLSHWIRMASKAHDNVHFLLVERSSTRFKVDGKHQSADATFQRLQVDIQHLDLSRVPLLRETGLPVVAVGKHLCGAATDLALRCLLERPGEAAQVADGQPPSKRHKPPLPLADSTSVGLESEASSAGTEEPRVSGLAIALCCHHRCDWRHYVGKEFFRERGLGPSEFSVFQRMSSWATCGMRPAGEVPTQPSRNERAAEEEEEEHDEPAEGAESDSLNEVVSTEERKHIGRLCKLLIDQGRVHFLKQKGFDCSLQFYTSTDVSLENVLLTALPSSPQGEQVDQLSV